MKRWSLYNLRLQFEQDVVSARQRAKQIAHPLGFEPQDRTRIATAVSELARNAFIYAGGGKVEFILEDAPDSQVLLVQVRDSGPGIPDLDSALRGESDAQQNGAGSGLIAAQKLVDSFHIDSAPGQGTTIAIRRALPADQPRLDPARLQQAVADLVGMEPRTAVEELRHQNQELVSTLEALERNQQELMRLNRELEDTNRGVVALYAELDEKAKELHRANQVKSRFLAHMSHEFRTPLNSVLALSRLLLQHADGELGEEQTKQVVYIRRAASELLEMVTDLLDLSKVEAGTMNVNPVEVDVEELFSTLRGMFLPLVNTPDVTLTFESAKSLPSLVLDELKVTQILRNFIANALKFTFKGGVRVSASFEEGAKRIRFSVADTGIGLGVEDRQQIFEEFKQLSNSAQQKTVGSGLGLAIARRLAEVLGGSVGVESTPGEGSTFYLDIPTEQAGPKPGERAEEHLAAERLLIIDDNDIDRYILRGLLADSGMEVIEAGAGEEGLRMIRSLGPRAVFLDLMMPGMNGFDVLRELREEADTGKTAVVVVTSKNLSGSETEILAEQSAVLLPKAEYSQGDAGTRVSSALQRALSLSEGGGMP